jgi:hypothetical protein
MFMDKLYKESRNLTKSKNRVRAELFEQTRKAWNLMVRANNGRRRCFGTFWSDEMDQEGAQRKGRKMLRLDRAHHHNACLYLHRDDSGRACYLEGAEVVLAKCDVDVRFRT